MLKDAQSKEIQIGKCLKENTYFISVLASLVAQQ